MAEEKYLKQAQTVYKTLCKTLDDMDIKYKKDEEELSIESGAVGEDIPVDIRMMVNPNAKIVVFYSQMPFEIPEDKRVDMSLAVTMVNYLLADGSFDYDFINGRIVFRMTSSFIDSLIGDELIEYMLYVSCRTVDDYNDKLEKIANGEMTLAELAELLSKH
jgi:hypothetical protein